ncbi:MAG: transcription-repair coupling factor [bacterium]|nr:transcription-repair coupling factor [bacterium]
MLEHRRLTLSGTGNLSAKAYFLSELMQHTNAELLERPEDGLRNFFWIIEESSEADKVCSNFRFWSSLPVHNFVQQPGESLADLEKMLRLYTILRDERKVVVMDPASFLGVFPSLKDIRQSTLELKTGEILDSMEVINRLLEMGYEFCADEFLVPGTYHKQGGILNIFVPTLRSPLKVELDGAEIAGLYEFDQETQMVSRKHESVSVVPLHLAREKSSLLEFLTAQDLLVDDEVDLSVEFGDRMKVFEEESKKEFVPISASSTKSSKKSPQKSVQTSPNHFPALVKFTAFPEEEDHHYFYLYYLSILKFQEVFDFLNDLREKQRASWKVMIFTKHLAELKGLLKEEKIRYSTREGSSVAFHSDSAQEVIDESCFLHLEDAENLPYIPQSFQNPDLKIAVLTDREIFDFRQIRKKVTKVQRKVNLEFLRSLKEGDYVVHVDHGIGRFLGIEQQTIDHMTREYLKIEYAANDKLYVPIDQAEKVNKYVGVGNSEPRLTRLGSGEWSMVTSKVKKEAESIAKELLLLYSQREMAKGHQFFADDKEMEQFERTFPYQETPGQMRAIIDVKRDMEGERPMDRLVCGDVGFGKTEVALRAAFKAVRGGKQVAVITPITILTDQHFKTFKERMEPFGVRIEMLSRFRSHAEQKKILKDMAQGRLDIVVGTHRLLQPDILFKDLGLVIIDEEQRFGVKQKERLKEMRASIDILTLTATPIPRTLHMSLNKFRDITIITTPPPGRLPIITEVRRFGDTLIKEAVDREVARGGQVYFLHNRVQTIGSMAEKLKILFPKLRIVVAHGKLRASDLEERIMAFKDGKYDILVSSTIIENGIDLPNANTLIVNSAEQFGLSQLYQLRGRIGRGKLQAYAYFLYHAQKLQPDAKRRLRAIVEANELGAGFQIAMHDLEIRGAGDVLGVSQSGAISVVGVSHFVRLLQQMVAELKAGKVVTQELEDLEKITIDLPITAFISEGYIEESREKINAYQRLSSATRLDDLKELREEFDDEYGEMPKEVKNLFTVLELKILARNASIIALRTAFSTVNQRELVLTMGKNMEPMQIGHLLQYNDRWQISGITLKIAWKDLGFKWIQGLRESLLALEKEVVERKEKAKSDKQEKLGKK